VVRNLFIILILIKKMTKRTFSDLFILALSLSHIQISARYSLRPVKLNACKIAKANHGIFVLLNFYKELRAPWKNRNNAASTRSTYKLPAAKVGRVHKTTKDFLAFNEA